MTPERWRRIRAAFDSLRGLSRPEQDAALVRLGGTDPSLARELREIFEQDRDEGFLEPSMLQAIAAQWAGEEEAHETSPPATAPSVEHAPELPVETEIGGYRIEAVLGRGSGGTVYRARQSHPNRCVAIKVLGQSGAPRADAHHASSPDLSALPSAIARFAEEVEVLGRLRHPGIATIFNAGAHRLDDGRSVPWYAMELVENGVPLTDYAARRAPSLHARIQLLLQVCDAVHHGHRLGIVHRDVKPANLLVEETGRVVVIDFGIARVQQERLQVDRSIDDAVGTPQYMSPEQWTGDVRDVDIRSDVFAIGVIAREILIQPDQARAWGAPRHRRDVAAIVAKATAVRRDQRYDTVAALAQDLENVCADRPVAARRQGVFARSVRVVPRHPVGALFVVLACVAALFGSVALWSSRVHAFETEIRRQQAAADADDLSGFIERLMSVVQRRGGGRDPRILRFFRNEAAWISERFANDPIRHATLFRRVGAMFDGAGVVDQATAFFHEAIAVAEKHGGPLDVTALEARLDLAGALERAERSNEAIEVLRGAIVTLESDRHRTGEHGDDGERAKASVRSADLEASIVVLEARHRLKLGRILARAGQPSEATAQLERAHAVFVQSLGESHALTRRAALWLEEALLPATDAQDGAPDVATDVEPRESTVRSLSGLALPPGTCVETLRQAWTSASESDAKASHG